MDVRHRRRLSGRPSGVSLARPGDRVEAFVLILLLAAALVVVGVGVWAANATADSLAEGPSAATREYAATATAVEDSHPVVGPGADGAPPMWQVPLAWSRPDGAPGHGTVLLGRAVAAGDAVPIVVDATGQPRAEHGLGGPALIGLAVGVHVILFGWLLLAQLWLVTESVVARRRAAAWAAEWERIERLWSARSE
jgi:hypothetical protein